jgi:7-cyano-7-deazaguanine reductase
MIDEEFVAEIPLGKSVDYGNSYDPKLLFTIERGVKRGELGIETNLPFTGQDIWNAYELSWLNEKGVPQVAIGQFRFSADTARIIESKSLKLYLNSLNQKKFASRALFSACIRKDLTHAISDNVDVVLYSVDDRDTNQVKELKGEIIDSLDIEISDYQYNASLLELKGADKVISEVLISNLLKSNCLITNQPDWASVYVEYRGRPICKASLLRYLVSFRDHNEFHEQCVERIYMDIMKCCKPEELTVYARYTRRGGLDINPWRSNCKDDMPNIRLSRQ